MTNRIIRAGAAVALAAAAALTVPSPATAATAPGGMAQGVHLQAAAPSCYLGTSYDFGPRAGSLDAPRGSVCWLTRTTGGKLAQLIFQSDGNFVLYVGGRPIWATGTNGRGNYLSLQSDGNVVIYDANGRAIWATMTNGGLNRRLVVQTDGNVVVYKTDWAQGNRITGALWATGTNFG